MERLIVVEYDVWGIRVEKRNVTRSDAIKAALYAVSESTGTPVRIIEDGRQIWGHDEMSILDFAEKNGVQVD